ncbi:hypothetical protein MUCCIDRAFT_106942 [Mucor lusitanicus CBS 277.49]|uniref:Rhomboid-type serine protease n=1 Tax=Mucor lusitanicus CBS 277.49 TaxID=747725 RepID=A0A162QWX9_MUCCL|nr:hypothetical protein MUCCIDRAFT_106942 [Mucor lusitanicus CBS 277.49]
MVNTKDNLKPTFSSPIISPDNDLGYYLHVPPFDHRQDQPRLAIASVDEFDKEAPKVYEVRPLQPDAEGSSPLFSPSINTSASTLEELKLAERQVFQQTCPETFDTIQNVYDPAHNRHYHFNKLKQMMNYYESSNGSTNNDSDNSGISMDCLHGQHTGPNIHRSPPKLKRYDSSKIVRYTLVDKELSHSKSTNSSYHQRLNQYDDDTRPATTHHHRHLPTPPPQSYCPTLHPRLQTTCYHDYWTTSDSSNYSSSSRDSKCSSQFHTTDSNYSTVYNQRNQKILKELGYSPNMFFGIQNSVQHLEEEKKKAEVTFYLRSPSQEEFAGTDSKQTKQLGIPYFTYLSTLVMIAYFAGCLIKNYQLTGAVIQLSPFNVMVGPSAETLIYTGARFTPCIRTSSLYPANEKIYTCPRNPASGKATRPRFNDQSSTGIFLTNKTSSQGACNLQSVCGGNSFNDPSAPDQGLGMQVEKRVHSGRYATIWLVSGVFGYLFGSLFVPEGNVSMGCSVPLMGIMAFLCVDLIRHWHTIAHPLRVLLCIVVYFVITLAVGLLPGYDNFSHIGGFIGGALITLATLPAPPSCVNGKYDNKSEQSMLIWLMRILMLAFIAVLMWILVYLYINAGLKESCRVCQYFSCLPFSDLCSPYS